MPYDVLLDCPEETFENTNEYISHLEERMLTIHQWARERLHFSSEKMRQLHNPQQKKGLSQLQYSGKDSTRSSASMMSSIKFRRHGHLNTLMKSLISCYILNHIRFEIHDYSPPPLSFSLRYI
ncbi:hypothetical protein LAZ67_X001313 [Cordylochernes scorpioides]|uniref:Uncharacterized protein n=1 Tax=Cordylochernes scorpioides TaxID=51811 RepID=A0ABY6LSC8_9ARAC|nr:hypothetical protein LAZ67_X001313 [Cordylochernes scorpioides]